MTNTSGRYTVVMAVKIVIAVLHLNLISRIICSQKGISAYTTQIKSCSPEGVNKRDIIENIKNIRGTIDCLRRCTRDVQCELAVYQELQYGSTSCTKLSGALDNSSTVLDVSTSRRCVAMLVNPCLNGGQLYDGFCLCQDGFTGKKCDLVNPSFCKVEWTTIATSTLEKDTILDPDAVKNLAQTVAKIQFKEPTLNVVSVMKGMDFGKLKPSSSSSWYLVTFPYLEKVAWNRFATNPQRQFLYSSSAAKYQLLSFNGTINDYHTKSGSLEFHLITPKRTQFAIKRTMPKDWTMIIDDMSNGFDMFQATWGRIDTTHQLVVAEFVDRILNTYVSGKFANPPETVAIKYVLGQQTYTLITFMGQGSDVVLGTGAMKDVYYLNPCWTRMTDVQDDGRASASGWKMLEAYLRLGHDVRVKVDLTYHTVLEVIQTGDFFYFVLAPYLSQSDKSSFTKPLYGVRSVLSSSAIYQFCTHQIEGEQVMQLSRTTSQYSVIWFVDTRKWNKVFTVSSNSSVLYGSVSDLISGVTNGSDVRVWIKWLSSDLSRFLDTHMSSVTGDHQVSTESLVTWKTTQDSSVELSLTCDLEYILVTSEGHVEILTFNYWTPGTSEVQSDVMITWFLA